MSVMSLKQAVHILDNPVWHALNTHHAQFALGAGLARRDSADIAPVIALADAPSGTLPPGSPGRNRRPQLPPGSCGAKRTGANGAGKSLRSRNALDDQPPARLDQQSRAGKLGQPYTITRDLPRVPQRTCGVRSQARLPIRSHLPANARAQLGVSTTAATAFRRSRYTRLRAVFRQWR